MKKVEEAVNTKRAWMNTKQHACSQAAKHSNPTVKCSEIRAEKSVSEPVVYPLVCSYRDSEILRLQSIAKYVCICTMGLPIHFFKHHFPILIYSMLPNGGHPS